MRDSNGVHVAKLYIFVMQTGNIEHRYRATISPSPTLEFSRLSVESPGHDDNLHSHRRRRFIFPFHFAGANFGRRNFTGEYIRAQKIPSCGTTRSFATNPPQSAPSSARGYPRKIYTVANFSQRVQSGIGSRLA